jgi:hypothetical protein
MTTANEAAVNARRAAQAARKYLRDHPGCALIRYHAEALIAATEEAAAQIDKQNHILFQLETEVYYADEATTREKAL